ncbi:MAG: hypothetical protein R6V46_05185 [Desulfatiglandaceae bacterium]
MRNRYEIPVFTITAFDFGFLTKWPDPLIPAGWLEAVFSGAFTFKSPWVVVFASSEQRPEKEQFSVPGLNYSLCSFQIVDQTEADFRQLIVFALLAAQSLFAVPSISHLNGPVPAQQT